MEAIDVRNIGMHPSIGFDLPVPSVSGYSPQIGARPNVRPLVMTRQALVDSLHEAFEECFYDWRGFGPMPPGIIVSRLTAEVLESVSHPVNPAHQRACHEPR